MGKNQEIAHATVFSIYMSNIDQRVVHAQKQCVDAVLPKGWTFYQHLHVPSKGELYPHATALTNCLNSSANYNDVTIFLDIDCIPLSTEAFLFLYDNASRGILAGAVQRANHINNDYHLYVGPFCLGLSKKKYEELGSPTFKETSRGDVAEELTYCWQAKNQPLAFLWPSSVYEPRWSLNFDIKFGLGTTYGTAGISPYMFYHTFNARDPKLQEMFITKCNEILKQNEAMA